MNQKSRLAEMAKESMNDSRWKECLAMSTKPKDMYKRMYPKDDPPIDSDEYDEEFTSSYRDFEVENFLTIDESVFERGVTNGSIFVKNNVYKDLNSDVSAISRVEMNWDDGYIQHNLISGMKADADEIDGSWFDALPDAQTHVIPGSFRSIPLKDRLFLPKMYAVNTYDIAFGDDKIGRSDYFFKDRQEFDSYFQDDPASSGCMLLDNPMNAEFIGFRSKMNDVPAFNDIVAYCQITGVQFPEICSMVTMLNYFAHEVLNVLIPKQIVLVMNSWTGGIDIPRRDYIPNIPDPVKNMPDYNNKMKHVVEMMKQIVSGRMFYVNMGRFYLKLSITPALVIVNYINSNAPNARLVLHLSAIDNQVLYDAEIVHNISPMAYSGDYNPLWHTTRNHDSEKDVLMSVQADYYNKLIGITGGELETFMKLNDINSMNTTPNKGLIVPGSQEFAYTGF